VSEQGSPSRPDLELFRSAIDAGRLGLWSWDLRTNRLTWSTDLEDFHGSPEGNLGGTFLITPAELPPQDATGVLAAIHKCLETREPCRLE